jgi:hypothetical protein
MRITEESKKEKMIMIQIYYICDLSVHFLTPMLQNPITSGRQGASSNFDGGVVPSVSQTFLTKWQKTLQELLMERIGAFGSKRSWEVNTAESWFTSSCRFGFESFFNCILDPFADLNRMKRIDGTLSDLQTSSAE